MSHKDGHAHKTHPKFHTTPIEGVLAARLSRFLRETIRELTAIVGEYLHDFHRCHPLQTPQKIGAAHFTLVAIDPQKHVSGVMRACEWTLLIASPPT